MTIIRRTPPPARVPLQVPAAPLPRSMTDRGFVPATQARLRGANPKFRGLMLATEGRSDTGKTEFLLSAPGPGVVLCCDRGFDAVFDNQTPPPSRRDDFGFKTLKIPKATDFQTAAGYQPYYQEFYKSSMDMIAIPEVRTACIDGDNFSWDLQRLAEWGRLQGIYPQTKYADPTAARMSFYWSLYDSGKIIIATNMVQSEWRNVMGADGLPVIDPSSKENKRELTGDDVAKGFRDQEYLWQARIRHLYKPARMVRIGTMTQHLPQEWGLRIMKCKANRGLVGEELWGDDCNFLGLVTLIYPHVDPKEWGF